MNTFDSFCNGKLSLNGEKNAKEKGFADLEWHKHPTFEGVELKHLITSADSKGQFSYHLVRIAPGKSIGRHIHETQLETHEVISGTGRCINNGNECRYHSGVISIFPTGIEHEIHADSDGLYLFAKFIPALC